MTLPASQYSVLDAQRVERLDADTFRCHVGGIKLLGFEVEPVITVSVVVGPRGPTVRLLETKVRGEREGGRAGAGRRGWSRGPRVKLYMHCLPGAAALALNALPARSLNPDSFSESTIPRPPAPQLHGSRMVQQANDRFQATMQNAVEWRETPGGGRALASDTSIRVALQVPAWFRLPISVIENTGCAVMRRVLDAAVPRFLQQLGRDYEVWAAGDESRAPLEEGGLGLPDAAVAE